MTDVTNEANTEASAEAKAPKEITTAKHARFLAEAARKRAVKFRTKADEADVAAAQYDVLAATLPESNPGTSSAKARPVLEVGTAVTQMDQSTQQNAALVEQATAAAQSLQQQAHELAQVVAGFKLPPAAGPGGPLLR